MSSTTPLLPKQGQKKDDHPIFLRVCHSPWVSIGQKMLVFLRGLLTAYMITAFLMGLNYEIRHQNKGWIFLFEFQNVVWVIQTIYQTIAFVSQDHLFRCTC
jgi:hypothetical protein